MDSSNGFPINFDRLTTLLPKAILLPIYPQKKNPLYRWRKINFAQSRRPRYQRWLSERANTGVALGTPSGNLCAIDVDNDQLLQEFVNLNPDFAGTLCSKGARGCQFWLQLVGDYPHCVHKLKTRDGEKWGEWRADGGQSIIRGIHPEGCYYRLLCDAPPIEIRFDDIKWPPGLILPWKNPPAPVATTLASPVPLPTGDISERVRRYLEKVPASIEGNGGDDQLFKAASILVNGFALSFEEALPFLREYNARAEPPWPERRLIYKLTEALFNPPPDKPHGYLHVDSNPFSPAEHSSYSEDPNSEFIRAINAYENSKSGNKGSESPSFAKKLGKDFDDVRDEEPQKTWGECLRGGMCSSEELSTMNIAPPKPILGDWLREGDLGFIFAQRGIGKTWLALDMAHGIAEKKNVGPWEAYLQEKCLYLDGEMPPGDIKKRDHALGQASKNLIYVNHEILFERTGRVMNLADADFQKAILDLCISEGFKILFLDNLSCLASGMDENKSMDWEILLPWLLRLRRAHITVIFIAHAGRNNQMRGHSKREDPAFWIMRLDAPLDVTEGVMGAHFITRFTKWRSVQKPATYQWSYKPVGNNGEDLCVEFKTANPIDIFRHLVESGMDTATHIAEEMEVSIGYISQLATRGKKEGWLDITNRRYHLTDT